MIKITGVMHELVAQTNITTRIIISAQLRDQITAVYQSLLSVVIEYVD